MNKVKVNGIEIELEDGMEMEVSEDGAKILIKAKPAPFQFVPYYPNPITVPLWPKPFEPYPGTSPWYFMTPTWSSGAGNACEATAGRFQ